jgi:hypothetical protein
MRLAILGVIGALGGAGADRRLVRGPVARARKEPSRARSAADPRATARLGPPEALEAPGSAPGAN